MSIHTPSHRRRAILTTMGVSVAFVLGCNKPEFERHPISGQITFKGQPVTSGFIVFEPDSIKGNAGPQGYSSIVHGRYDTDRDGKGAVLGPVKVRIVGLNSVAATEDSAGTPLFRPYEVELVLSEETTTKDFDVPAANDLSK